MGGQNNQMQQGSGVPSIPPVSVQTPEGSPLYIEPSRPWSVPSANPEAISKGINSGVQASMQQVGSAYLSDLASKRAEARQADANERQIQAQKQLYRDQMMVNSSRPMLTPFFPTTSQP